MKTEKQTKNNSKIIQIATHNSKKISKHICHSKAKKIKTNKFTTIHAINSKQ